MLTRSKLRGDVSLLAVVSARQRRVALLVAAAALTAGGGGAARAAANAATTLVAQASDQQQLLDRMRQMEQRIRTLEQQQQQRGAPAPEPGVVPAQPTVQAVPPGAPPAAGNKDLFGIYPSPLEGLRLGAYGEFKFGAQQNPANSGHWEKGFDAARVVLLPSYAITDSISFNAEIEFEHGGAAFDNDDKLHGTAEIEQAFLDFKVRDYVNFHSPGIDLVPIGYTNLVHEPTTFYSVNRPELANGLIPTTLQVPSWGTIYGKVTPDIGYQVQISNSIEDFGDSFDARGDAHTAPAGPYAAGIDGLEALSLSKPPVGDFAQLNNELAYALRISYSPPVVPGLAGSTSIYYSPNIEPRGAHSELGTPLGKSSLTLVDSELRYRLPGTGFEFRGEYVQAFFGNTANLRANNDSDPTNNVGNTMWGASAEVAYHFRLGRGLSGDWEAVPFYRYTYEDLQTGGFRGTDDNASIGAGRLQFHTVGVAVFPTPKVVLKANYQHVESHRAGGAKSDSVLGGVGFFF
jgi:hypothetical protein